MERQPLDPGAAGSGAAGTNAGSGSAGPDAGAGAQGGMATTGCGGDCRVPTDQVQLRSYLEAGRYKSFSAEASIHPSPVHGRVKVFINPLLEASLKAAGGVHPPASAAVKELYDASDRSNGWAVMVKLKETSDTQSWYWYELLNDRVVVSNPDAPTCTGCHAQGRDFFTTKYPFAF